MDRIPLHIRTTRSLLAFALLAAMSSGSYGSKETADIPANARATSYGSGWECNRGYQNSAGSCVAITIPPNAYATDASYGRGWECKHGYRDVDNTCVAVKVPANGYLDASGKDWKCNRGYRPVRETCEEIRVPANAFYVESSYGTGWQCARGYSEVNGACIAVVVPENGHLNHAGNDWECDRPFRKEQKRCIRQ